MTIKLTFLGVLFPLFAWSQVVDTAILLPKVEVRTQALRAALLGTHSDGWNGDDLEGFKESTLADLLTEESGVFIKTYGLGGSATIALRGGSAGHTAVLWNGLPIDNPMLGLVDFSLIPTVFLNGVSVDYGGNSAAWGSGAVGGVIALKNGELKRNGFEFGTSAGSFGRLQGHLESQFRIKKWVSVSRLFFEKAENDFSYKSSSISPLRKVTNGAVEQKSFLQEFYWSPCHRQRLSIRLWGQFVDRQIPPTEVQTRSIASQSDRIFRSSVHWKSVGAKRVWEVRSGVFREGIHYQDPERSTDAKSLFWKVPIEAELKYFLNSKQYFVLGLSHHWSMADIINYQSPPQQNRSAVFVTFEQNIFDWRWQLSGRQEMVDGRFIPFSPALGIEKELQGWLKIRAMVSRNYRLPTFNDLYWQPGGNIDLLPESGWGEELGFEVHRNWVKFDKKSMGIDSIGSSLSGRYGFTFFNRRVNNWIFWSPINGGGLWSPQNLTKVWSRGIEQRVSKRFRLNKSNFQISGGHDFVFSTNQVSLSTPKVEKGEQLWYVPKNRVFGSLKAGFGRFEFKFWHQYTSSVRTLNYRVLASYHLESLEGAYLYKQSRWQAKLIFSINNLWNTSYRVIEYRPMPGRNFHVSLYFQTLN